MNQLSAKKKAKLDYWYEIVKDCQKSGLTNQQYCQQHEISLKSYYYYHSKLAKMAECHLPAKTASRTAEIPNESDRCEIVELKPVNQPEASVVLRIGGGSITIDESVSDVMLKRIFEALRLTKMMGDISKAERIYIAASYTDL